MQTNFLRLFELPLTLSRSVSELSLESLSMKAFRLPILVILIKTCFKEGSFKIYTKQTHTKIKNSKTPKKNHYNQSILTVELYRLVLTLVTVTVQIGSGYSSALILPF